MADHQKTPTVRDWENREFNETVSWNLRKLLDYMNTFGLSLSSLFFSHTDCSAKHITFAHLLCSPFVCAVPQRFADLSVRFKLGQVNEKLEVLERQVEYLESCYSTLTIQTQS